MTLPLHAGDQIVASLESDGRLIARLSEKDFGSIDELVSLAYSLAEKFMGIARLTIRNKTQGWSKVLSLAARRTPAPLCRRATRAEPVVRGRQFLIPFA